jgi:hypothetical protein
MAMEKKENSQGQVNGFEGGGSAGQRVNVNGQ